MTRLSVNLNKVALLRNQRDTGQPDLLEHAKMVLDAGAQGLTAHPRPDERHIRQSDIPLIAGFLKTWPNKSIEFNIEGYPSEDFIRLVTRHECDQVTLVPDDPNQKTSDHGWDIPAQEIFLSDVVRRLKEAGRRVSLFIDPKPDMARAAADIGAQRVELFTGPYAFNPDLLPAYVETAEAGYRAGLEINAGHDLNLHNLARFISAVPRCAEVSIGHALTSDALLMGWQGAVTAYLTAIQYGRKAA
jgi:pyridoxine 5-phosphate synthase